MKPLVPNDSLQLRRQVFTKLMTPDKKTNYMDGAGFDLLRPYNKEHNFDLESRLWIAFLYGMSYSTTTAIRFSQEFPTIKDVKPATLKAYWASERNSLYFLPDKKYLKNMNQVVPAIKSLYTLSKGNLESYLTPYLEEPNLDSLYKEIRSHWAYFGTHGAFLFFDALYTLAPEKYNDITALDWKNGGQTVVEGMAHLLGDDEAIDTKQYNFARYNKMVDKLSKKFNQPRIAVESQLCFFRKLFKGTRYMGYYADRQLVECLDTAELLKDRYNIDIWKYREQAIPEYMRGEVGGWNSIRKDRLNLFKTTGELYP